MERIVDLTVEPAGWVVHLDRVDVARSHSDHGHGVLVGLVARCWQEVAALRLKVVAGIDSKPMLRLYRLVGVEVTGLGPARPHWNEERFPVRIDVGEVRPARSARWQALAFNWVASRLLLGADGPS